MIQINKQILANSVLLLLSLPMTAQTQKEYGKAYIEAIADNTHIYVSKRPK